MSQYSEPGIEMEVQSRGISFLQIYSPEALSIAKVMLLAHSNRVPVKKKDMMPIVQRLVGSTKEYTRAEIRHFYSQAKEFLRRSFALNLIDLPVVSLGLEHETPQRGELMLSSTITGVREMLLANASATQKRDWGLLCLVVMMIVLNGNGIAYSQVLKSVRSTRLFQEHSDDGDLNNGSIESTASTAAGPDKIADMLASSLQRLIAQRYLEKRIEANKENTLPAEERADTEYSNVILYIGPYTKETLPANDLKTMILELQFPEEDIESEVFLQQHEVMTRGLDLKLEASVLKFVSRSQE